MHRQCRQASRLCQDDFSIRRYECQRGHGALQISRDATSSKSIVIFPLPSIQILFVILPLLTYIIKTRWGVGFGPRDCSDYQTGISIIPIDRLTDADRKWMLSAEYGGTGGKSIEPGLVVEEPDIEIGAGVSSKGNAPPPSSQNIALY